MIIRLTAIFVISIFCSPAFAGGKASCDEIIDLQKVLQCFLNETDRLDKETVLLGRRMSADNPGGCSECVITSFHSFRETACNFYRSSLDKGSMASLGNASCKYRLTKQFLESQDIFYSAD